MATQSEPTIWLPIIVSYVLGLISNAIMPIVTYWVKRNFVPERRIAIKALIKENTAEVELTNLSQGIVSIRNVMIAKPVSKNWQWLSDFKKTSQHFPIVMSQGQSIQLLIDLFDCTDQLLGKGSLIRIVSSDYAYFDYIIPDNFSSKVVYESRTGVKGKKYYEFKIKKNSMPSS